MIERSWSKLKKFYNLTLRVRVKENGEDGEDGEDVRNIGLDKLLTKSNERKRKSSMKITNADSQDPTQPTQPTQITNNPIQSPTTNEDVEIRRIALGEKLRAHQQKRMESDQ